MRRFVISTLLLLCGFLGIAPVNARAATHRPREMKIFVDLQGSDPALANMYTAKLISHLIKHGFSVVESVDDADAVLHGAGLIQSYSTDYGHTRYFAQAGMRLVDKDGNVLWADDIRSSRYAESASSSFAENVAKNLDKALSEKDK